MEIDLVFEGGGAKGLAFVGALKALERCGHKPRRVIGTSAGCITAMMVAAGYDAQGCFEAINERLPNGRSRFTSFLETPQLDEHAAISGSLRYWINTELDNPLVPNLLEPTVDKLVCGLMRTAGARHLLSLLLWGGWYAGDALLEYFADKLDDGGRNLGRTTLCQFAERTGRDLSVVASDVTGREMLVLNHRTAPDCPTIWAVRMSMSFPFVWPEVQWRKEWGTYRGRDLAGHRVVDGGLLSNFPIELLVSTDAVIEEIMGCESNAANAIGLLLDDDAEVPGAECTAKSEDGVPDFLENTDLLENMKWRLTGMAETVLTGHDRSSMRDFAQMVCCLPVKGYGTFEFDLTPERMAPILAAGDTAMAAHLKARFGGSNP